MSDARAGGERPVSLALGVGLLAAAVAIALRLFLRSNVAGEQAIFSYPAIVVVTLLYGARAGSVTAAVCFLALWYYVIPVHHSFHLAGPAAAITLGVYALVGSLLIWAVDSTRRTSAHLREINLHLEQLVEQRTSERNRVWERSREFVVIVAEDGRIRAANPALSEALGGVSDIDGRSFEDLLIEADRPAFREALKTGNRLFEARLEGPRGIVWVSWSVARDAGSLYLIGRDFTAEHECSEMLQQSQKLELVGQLAGGLAHDFGNLLPPISMTLHLLRKRHAGDTRTDELISGAEESVDRAGHLIRRLLNLSQPSRIESTVRPLGPLLEEIALLMRQVIGDRRLDVELQPDLPDVRVDANQLDMAVLNLFLNARDATAPDGTITLQAATTSPAQVEIVVSDDGAGMDEQTLSRATEPFFTTKASGEGTGLGLPMVHNFAVAAGGRLTITSRPGHGTRASLILPAMSRARDGASGS